MSACDYWKQTESDDVTIKNQYN